MRKQLLFICLLPVLVFSQTTIWEEDFESYASFTGLVGPNSFTESGGYTTSAVTKWVLDASSLILSSATTDYFYVNVSSSSGDGELYVRDVDGKAYFTTENIDISSETGDVTLKIGKLDFEPFSSGDFNGSEYVDIYYSLDDGATYTLIPYQDGSENTAGHTFADDGATGVDFSTSLDYSFDPGAATTVKIRINMYNNGSNERFEIDDISVERNATALWSENFDSYPDNYGYVGISGLSPANLDSGDYPGGVTKWTLTPSAGFANQLDYTAVVSSVLRFNDIDNAVTFETENINISGTSDLVYSLDVSFGNSYDGGEYLDIYYSIDGGATFVKEGAGTHTYEATVNITDDSTVNFSKTLSGLSATDFRIRIVAFSEANNEDFVIDNLKVVEPATASIDEFFTASVNVYPNPLSNNKILNIDSPLNGSKKIQLFNLLGKEVISTQNVTNSVNLNHLKTGIYILRIEEDNKIAVKRIIIK